MLEQGSNHKSLTVLRTVIVLPRLIHPKPLIHSVTLGYTCYPSTLSQQFPVHVYETYRECINFHSKDVTQAFKLLSPS